MDGVNEGPEVVRVHVRAVAQVGYPPMGPELGNYLLDNPGEEELGGTREGKAPVNLLLRSINSTGV